jgi:DNA-binding transcriptional LysR family regulator
MRVTFKQLEYFAAAADAGSITAASERINISAPSISTAISQLEDELRCELFLRHRTQGLVLTPAGERLLAEVRTILQLAGRLHDVSRSPDDAVQGRLSVGALSTLAPLVLPELCHGFVQRNPGVSFDLTEGSQDQIISRARRGLIDVAVTYDMHIPADVVFEPLIELQPFIMVAANHKLAAEKSVDLRELASEGYVLLDLPYSRDYFLSVWQAVGLAPSIVSRVSQQEVVRTMVANGYGIAIAVARPRNQEALDGKPLMLLPIRNQVPSLHLGLLSPRQEETRLSATFRDHCRKVIAEGNVPGMVST